MKSVRIYQADSFQVGKSFQLDKFASHHLIKVLRLKSNYTFTLFDGKGTEFSATLEVAGKHAIAHVLSSTETSAESNLKIHLLQAISKGDRMDFAIQKSIELGVTSITPIITERTVVNLKEDRGAKKLLHWSAIAIGACEQSGRNFLPKINPICNYSDAINSATDGIKLLLDPLSNNSIQSLTADKNVYILIGPEGGLSDKEIELAKDQGFHGVRLGPRILRTETAALAAITSVQLLWGDLG